MRVRVPWRDELDTGIAGIDSVHREIFRRMNQLLAACERGKGRAELVPLVTFLDEYVAEHFEHEESMQQEAAFPDLEKHREEHGQFNRRFDELKRKVEVQGNPVHLVVEGTSLLAKLLFEHIGVSDAAFAAHMRRVREQEEEGRQPQGEAGAEGSVAREGGGFGTV